MGWLLVAGWCRRRIGVVRLDRRSGSSLVGEDGVRLPCFGGLGGGSIAFFVVRGRSPVRKTEVDLRVPRPWCLDSLVVAGNPLALGCERGQEDDGE